MSMACNVIHVFRGKLHDFLLFIILLFPLKVMFYPISEPCTSKYPAVKWQMWRIQIFIKKKYMYMLYWLGELYSILQGTNCGTKLWKLTLTHDRIHSVLGFTDISVIRYAIPNSWLKIRPPSQFGIMGLGLGLFEIGIMEIKSNQKWIFNPCKIGITGDYGIPPFS